MKKIYIGRGIDCDIRIKDDTDKVSRRQAVIEVSPFGKMRIYDTSTNGTFVNGEPVEKPGGREVKRGDAVDMAHVVNLDWNLVKDPYRSMKISLGVILLALIGLAVYLFVFSDVLTREDVKEPEPQEVVAADSIADDSAAEASEPSIEVATPSDKDKKKSSKKSKGADSTSAAPPKKSAPTPYSENDRGLGRRIEERMKKEGRNGGASSDGFRKGEKTAPESPSNEFTQGNDK